MPDLENGFVWIAAVVSNVSAMQSLDRDLIHFVGDRVIPVTGQAVDTGPNQAMRSDLLCRAEELVDVALAITVWTHRPGSSKSSVDCFRFSNHRMLSFFSMGTRVGLIFFFRALVPLNFFRVPYSPDLNPIEQVFAKLKALLQKAAKRTIEATWRHIGSLLAAFSPEECENYFRNAGYASN